MNLEAQAFYKLLEKKLESENSFKNFRVQAFKALQGIGLPSAKTEAYRYLRIQSLLKIPYESVQLEKPSHDKIEEACKPFRDSPYLVIYNGQFLPRYSNFEGLDPQIVVKPLYEAALSYGLFFKNVWNQWIKSEQDPLTLLTLSFSNEGAFVYIPKNIQQKKPIALIEMNEGAEGQISLPLSFVSVGKHSEVQFIRSVHNQGAKKFISSSVFFSSLEEGAITSFEQASPMSSHFSFDSFRVWQKGSSQFKMVAPYIQSVCSRFDCHIQLFGRDSEAEVLTLSALKDKQEMHTHILVEHHDESSYSRQLVKNLYDGESRGSFEGKIFVHPKAQQTNAYQLNQNCILSDQATAYSKPNLEIFADDVKASHGSTTGQIDKEQLFYLQSRGLSKEESQKLLLQSFCDEVTNSLKSKALREILESQLENYF